MRPEARALLWDIERAAAAIDQFVAGLDSSAYANSDLIHSAVERKFEIIGEALNRLAKAHPGIAGRIPRLREIIAFRNVLVHGYAAIEHDRVWRIALGALPTLRETVARLLAEQTKF